MAKMTKEEVVKKISQESKDEASKLIETIKSKVASIEEGKTLLVDQGTKSGYGKIRESAQELKKLAQDVRVLSIKIRNEINKK